MVRNLHDAQGPGNAVEVGAWDYGLVKDPDKNWYLQRTGNQSSDAQIATGIPALHLSVVKTGMNELRKRLGDLRNNNQNEKLTGVWARGYAKEMDINDKASTDMSVYGFEAGIDGKIEALGARFFCMRILFQFI